MKWSWKSFGIQVATLIAGGLLLAWGIALLFHLSKVPGTPMRDYLFTSCFLGSLCASLIFAVVGSWRLRPFWQILAAVATASTLMCYGAAIVAGGDLHKLVNVLIAVSWITSTASAENLRKLDLSKYDGILPAGIFTVVLAACLYGASTKIRLACAWYLPSKAGKAIEV